MNLKYGLAAIGRLLRDEEGPAAVEYAVLLALIIVVCISSIVMMADATNESFEQSGEAIEGAFGG